MCVYHDEWVGIGLSEAKRQTPPPAEDLTATQPVIPHVALIIRFLRCPQQRHAQR